MVNKIHFGKRIAILRRKAGLSQSDLAEKLGVTSQAVSKWECGNAVPDIDILLELSHLYKVTINEMLEDVDLLCDLTGKETGRSGIAYFVPEQERDYNIEWANEIRSGNWIKHNWENSRVADPFMDKVGEEIASCNGIILEIGVGPGRLAVRAAPLCGEFVGIDISPKTVKRAKENLSEYKNVNIICADFLSFNFDRKFDVIYSSLTFMHIEDKQRAVNKIAGLLNGTGRFVLSIDKNSSEFIDAGTRRIRIFPDTPVEMAECIGTAGLTILKRYDTEFATIFVAQKDG